MFKHSMFLLLLFIFYSADTFANAPTHTLFAVDVSLSANEKETAFEIIRRTTHVAPETHSIGLTLFDDTVRGYVAPAQLDEKQIKALHNTMADAPVSVRSTSNFTIGIERAIDAFEPIGGANLVVFSRGIIDTKSQDPRAQYKKFIEWLDEVLLPQATQSNIAVNLVVNQSQANQESNLAPTSKEISDLFTRTDKHSIINLASSTKVAPELISLLNIPEGDFAQGRPSDASVSPSATAAELEGASQISTEDISEQTSAIEIQESSNLGVLSIARMVLLAVCLALLVGIIIWRYRTRSASRSDDDTAHSSSSYLPLTRKPSEAMEEYMEKETDLVIKPDSNDKQ